jgi:chorismate mutase/prephenate dehydratase
MKQEVRPELSQKFKVKRKALDLVDRKLLALLNQRLHIAQEIGRIKRKMGIKIYDPRREMEVLKRLEGTNKGPLNEEDLIKIFTTILRVCRRSQT